MSEWNEILEIPFGDFDLDIKLNDGSILRNCSQLIGGDYLWSSAVYRFVVDAIYVVAWKPSEPPKEGE